MEKTIIFNKIKFYNIKDFNDYYISKCGKIFSTKSHKILKYGTSYNGYFIVTLTKNNKTHSKRVNRLVAQQFIYNHENKPQVDHIDNNKKNNNLNNLQWMTSKENINKAHKDGLIKYKYGKDHHYYGLFGENHPRYGKKCHLLGKKGKNHPAYGRVGKLNQNSMKVKQLDLEGNVIKIWWCISEAGRELNIYTSNICRVCQGKRKTMGGFKWEYL